MTRTKSRTAHNLEIRGSGSTGSPMFAQIADQIKQMVATGHLLPGERLPTIRQLSQSLAISPGTVVKAYLELENEGVIQSRRGRGTIVATKSNDPTLLLVRQMRLSSMISKSILEALSLGYSPEEIEAEFSIHLDRWQDERRGKREPVRDLAKQTEVSNKLVIVASHDLALNMLVARLKHKNSKVRFELTYAGSLGGLIALQQGRANLAGIHLLDAETGEYNYPYIRHVLPGRRMAVVHLACRIQGLMVAGGNPKKIRSIKDLARPDVSIINRQPGSGTRLLLDQELRKHGIASSCVKGYDRQEDTHIAVARNIAQRVADAGLGIEAAARACGLDFLPLCRERYDLVMPFDLYRSNELAPLLNTMTSENFQKAVTRIGGYDTSQTGSTIFIGVED